ncbi:hypothetical protein JXB01_01190 [Candidatus Micrarchaeota archaeon]|nr:hypothetical protein [Candidatus Micrarchaeota archaeon]
MDLKRTFAKHFRILLLAALLTLIVILSMNITYAPEVLHFKTYYVDIGGSGNLKNTDAVFDFSRENYTLYAVLGPGNYSISSNIEFQVYSKEKSLCKGGTARTCTVSVQKEETISVLFLEPGMLPNGHFRFSFLNPTNINVIFNLGKNYSFFSINSLLPRTIHGHYSPEENAVNFETLDFGPEDERSDYVDFDLYCSDAINGEINKGNEWMEDYVIVPLIVSFLILLISDIIDSTHNYIQKHCPEEEKKRKKSK